MTARFPSHRPSPGLSVAALGAAAFLVTLGHGFAFDDDIVLLKNRWLGQGWTGLADLLLHTEWAGGGLEVPVWRPLTALTYALDHAISGFSPSSWHLTNVGLHALASWLVWRLARSLGDRFGLDDRAAFLAGALFAVHPIHVEAVANVVGRKDVLATILILTALLARGRAVREGGWWLAVPGLALLGACLSKEVGAAGLALLVLLVGFDRWVPAPSPPPPGVGPPPTTGRRVAVLAGAALATLAYLLARRAVTGSVLSAGAVPFDDNPLGTAGPLVRVATAVVVLGKGLLLQLLPVGQSPDWSFDALPVVRSAADPRLLASAALLAGWGTAALALRRRAPLLLLALAWYLVAVLPASNLLFPAGTIFGERLLYLPSVATTLLAGAALSAAAGHLPARPATLGAALAAALLLALGLACARYASAWSDDLTLFRWASAATPRSAKVHLKLGDLLHRRGELAAGLEELEQALAISPGFGRAEASRGLLLSALGRTAEAEASLLRAISLEPRDADAAYEAGRLAAGRGAIDQAAALWRHALSARPGHAGALADLAAWHAMRGEDGAALDLAGRAVEADPAMASAWYTLGLLRERRGDAAGAREARRRFVEVAGPAYAAEADAVRRGLEAQPPPGRTPDAGHAGGAPSR